MKSKLSVPTIGASTCVNGPRPATGESTAGMRAAVPANVVGAVCWGAGLLTLGHLAASTPVLKQSAAAVAAVVVAGSVVAGVVRVRLERNRG